MAALSLRNVFTDALNLAFLAKKHSILYVKQLHSSVPVVQFQAKPQWTDDLTGVS